MPVQIGIDRADQYLDVFLVRFLLDFALDLLEAVELLEKMSCAYDIARAKFLLASLYYNQGRPGAEEIWLDAASRIVRGGYAFILERERGLAFPLVEKHLHSRKREVRQISESLLEYLANVPPLPLRVTGLGYFRVWQGRRPIQDGS